MEDGASNQVSDDGCHEMLKALYDFRATFAKTLSFLEGDLFILHHEHTKQRNWWRVVNEKAQVGYVPSNYVATVKVSGECWRQFVDKCLSTLDDEQTKIGEAKLPVEKVELLQLLTGSDTVPTLSKNTPSSSRIPSIAPVHSHGSGMTEPRRTASSPGLIVQCRSEQEEINPEVAYLLVEQVRLQTRLSHELSRVAVAAVVSGICSALDGPLDRARLQALVLAVKGPLAVSRNALEGTHDARRLRVVFDELISCKDDSQQRSWSLHEDESTICEYIDELVDILNNADTAVSRLILSFDGYAGVSALVQFHQMETRWSVRQRLLQAFGLMCGLDLGALNLLLDSVLPSELARHMQSNPRNVPCLTLNAVLLSMLFSMGEPMPFTHRAHLGCEFASFLLDLVESTPDTDVEEKLPDLLVRVLLAYNLQFTDPDDNLLLMALSGRSVAKTFTEKILLLINREEDPVRVFEHQPAPSHSVLKLFIDLFSLESTAGLFYTNDVTVLIDIIVRQLADLSPGEKRRGQYLRLCQLVVRNTNYGEHCHRQDDILKCFTRIFCEENDLSHDDQRLAREIADEFPQHFKAIH